MRDPKDAFLAANTHRDGISPFDDLQPPYAALISGSFHPTAEGHAIVADHVLRHVNALLAKRKLARISRGSKLINAVIMAPRRLIRNTDLVTLTIA